MCWVSSKLITRIVFAPLSHNIGNLVQWELFGRNADCLIDTVRTPHGERQRQISTFHSRSRLRSLTGQTPLGWNRGGIALLSRKSGLSLKLGKIGPRLLLMTNRKSHTFDWCQNQRPWMIVKGHYALCFKTHASFGAHHENLNKDRPVLSATKM